MDGRKSEKFGPVIYTQKIYILSIALYIYVYIYIGKVAIAFGKATKEGTVSPSGPQLRPPTPGQTTKPSARSLWPSVAFHILGRGQGEVGEGGLVSKLGCNLRKSPGSVGSGKPSGGKAPHLVEKGGALGAVMGGRAGRHRLPPTPLPWPGWGPGPQGPPSFQSPFWGLEADKPSLEGTQGRGNFCLSLCPGPHSCH